MALHAFKDPQLPEGDWGEIPRNIKQKHFKHVNGLAFVLDNVFSPKECSTIIEWTESFGYVKASLGNGRVVEQVRKSDRCIIDSDELSQVLFNRIEKFLPKKWNGESLTGLNERLRFLRYYPGGYFKPHGDGFYEREDKSERSCLTCQLYLNGGFEGGATTFLPRRREKGPEVPCVPQPGRVLIFQHELRHEGSLLKSGTKYAVRTDVMYTCSI